MQAHRRLLFTLALPLAACQPPTDTAQYAPGTLPTASSCGTDPDALYHPATTTPTTVPTNLAIDGLGWFPVREGARALFTRTGNFFLDDEGRFVDARGLILQGDRYDLEQVRTSGDLRVARGVAPRATTRVALHVNLDAGSGAPQAWDATKPSTTSNWSTSARIYDSLGGAHKVDVYFRNAGAGGAWEWHAMVDGGEVGGVKETPTQIADGTLTFDTGGFLTSVVTNSSSASFTGASPNQQPRFDFGSETGTGGVGLDSTSFVRSFDVTFNSSDGFAAGSLRAVAIDADGAVDASYDNGLHLRAAQVLLARFAQPLQLTALGGHRFLDNACSGAPTLDLPGTFALGLVRSGTVEQ